MHDSSFCNINKSNNWSNYFSSYICLPSNRRKSRNENSKDKYSAVGAELIDMCLIPCAFCCILLVECLTVTCVSFQVSNSHPKFPLFHYSFSNSKTR